MVQGDMLLCASIAPAGFLSTMMAPRQKQSVIGMKEIYFVHKNLIPSEYIYIKIDNLSQC